jgi:hypothetical protein
VRTPPEDESIPQISLISAFRILLLKHEYYSNEALTWSQRILSLCRGVFRSEAVAEAFIYLCRKGASTCWLLQVQLGMPEATAYRVLKQLRSLKLVEPVLKLPKRRLKRSGPIPRVWGLVGCYAEEDVARCIILHYRTLSPKYRLAVEVAQSMLDRYIRPRGLKEVSYREILLHVKEMRTPFSKPDVADLAAQYLHEKGIKIWR